tara:strand:+ start:1701 stop:2360 length:660 start_codon:yes stop_codon:yes gene_type:complete
MVDRDQLYKKALDQARRMIQLAKTSKISHTISQEGPTSRKFEENIIVEKLVDRWGARKAPRKSIDSTIIPHGNVLVVLNSIKVDPAVLFKYDNIYSIVGDYKMIPPSGTGCYIIDVHDSKYLPGDPNVLLYFGSLVGKYKKLQKIWTRGDIRSFKHVDESIYKPHIDLNTGRLITATTAGVLLARKHHPNELIELAGVDISILTAWEQTILSRENIRCI